MVKLPLLILGLFALSQGEAESTIGIRIESIFEPILEHKLNNIRESKLKLESLAPKSVGNFLVLEATPTPCPDAAVILNEISELTALTTKLLADGITVYSNAFKVECPTTFNPITKIKCYLRAFRKAHESLSSLEEEAKKVVEKGKTLINDYEKYHTNCTTTTAKPNQ